MVGVGMRFENPLDRQAVRLNECNDGIGADWTRATGLRIVIEHWIDDDGRATRGLKDDVGEG